MMSWVFRARFLTVPGSGSTIGWPKLMVKVCPKLVFGNLPYEPCDPTLGLVSTKLYCNVLCCMDNLHGFMLANVLAMGDDALLRVRRGYGQVQVGTGLIEEVSKQQFRANFDHQFRPSNGRSRA